MKWKLLLILGTLTLMICVSCSMHKGQALYQPSQILQAPKATDFCDQDTYPAEGDVIEPRKCKPIECDLIFQPSGCTNVI